MQEFDFTNEQMFFIANAQFYCNKSINDHEHFSAKLQDKDSPHGAGRVRVNAMSMQMEEFRTAFSCKSTDPMVIEKGRICHLLPKTGESRTTAKTSRKTREVNSPRNSRNAGLTSHTRRMSPAAFSAGCKCKGSKCRRIIT